MSAFDEQTTAHLIALKSKLTAKPDVDQGEAARLAIEIIDDLDDLFREYADGPTLDDLQEHYGESAAVVRAAVERAKKDGALDVVWRAGVGRLAPAEPAQPTQEPARVAPTQPAKESGTRSTKSAAVAEQLLEHLRGRFAGQEQFAPPTHRQLTQEFGVSEFIVSKAMDALISRGAIVLVQRGRLHTPSVYRWGDGVGVEKPTLFANPAPEPTAFRGGVRPAAKVSTLARFSTAKAEPERVVPLRPDHPALLQERTLFPTTVVSPWESPALLVSGHNNGKLGGEVTKGEWAGMPLYHLTLEERATCPRSCAVWDRCMGNGMHMARRHDHRDPHFLPLLEAELWMLSRKHPQGFVVRLHTLGDFYSVEYVRWWANAIDTIPGLHAYGYTGCHPNAEDEREAEIGRALMILTEAAWDHFAIRFSGHPGPQGAVVVEREFERDWLMMCPQQTDKTATCGTCGLCWAEPMRDKTIGFLLHGPKRGGGDDAE